MPALETELGGVAAFRTQCDLTGYTQSRLSVSQTVAGNTGSVLKGQYSLDQSVWVDLTSTVNAASANLVKVSTWTTIPVAARTDVFLRVVGSGGDGVADPTWFQIAFEVR